jgi:uncharacterized damage-inducible protein DinB
MLVQSLMTELRQEADNTRKIFDALPDSVLPYRPNDFNWSIAELAAHIAENYHWWPITLHQDVFETTTYVYDKGDISNTASLRETLEQNIAEAVRSLDGYPEARLHEPFAMQTRGTNAFPPMPRTQVVRSFLMNHLYHHRGEMIAYLRINGLRVPGLYGPSYEEQQAAQNGAR